MDLSSRLTGQTTELLVMTNMSCKYSWFSACETSSKQGEFPWTRPLALAIQETPSLKLQTMDWDGLSYNVLHFLFTLHDCSAQSQHIDSAPWQDICIFVSRWLKISDMFVSWILPWQLERAVTSIAKYAAFFFPKFYFLSFFLLVWKHLWFPFLYSTEIVEISPALRECSHAPL